MKKASKCKDLILLFDAIRDPRDIAEVIHLGIAAGISIEFTGNSIPPENYKVLGILDSWILGFKEKPDFSGVKTYPDFFKRIKELKKLGYSIIGTSPLSKKSLFSSGLSNGKHAIIFGTETSGLSKEKLKAMDEVISIPMRAPAKFFTIRAAAPVITYEAMRQKGLL